MSELKPCPFCDGVPLLSPGMYDYDGGDRYYYYSATFECTCGLTFEVRNKWPKVYTSSENALDFAIDAWNTRAERTCKAKLCCDGFYRCTECGWVMLPSSNYCSKCGAKVVKHG